MPDTRHITPNAGDALLLVGTMKGAFILRAESGRRAWEMGGPYFPGSAVYAIAFDGRAGRQRLWAGPHSMHWGGLLRSSDDFGRTWTNPETANVKFPEGAGAALQQIWQIVPGRVDEPETLYCGVEPAALFVSHDGGEKWSLTDGGATWRPSNHGVRADFLPDKYPEFGQCVHKVVQSRQRPDRMFLQNHWGLYRSDDRGENWTDVANGVPSDFGFPIVIHPRDPDSAWIVPLEADSFRCTPEGKLRVYRTHDAGGSWEAMTDGLPQHDAYETVLRDAMAVDALQPAGVYFGTRSGKLFGSSDEGQSWTSLADGLPPIVAVKTAIVGF